MIYEVWADMAYSTWGHKFFKQKENAVKYKRKLEAENKKKGYDALVVIVPIKTGD